MLNFANFIPDIAACRYKLKFTSSLKRNVEEVYLEFIKGVEEEMKQAINTIENYEKTLENDILRIYNGIEAPISKGFCDKLCMKCNNDGSHSINNVGYHKSCSKCLGLLENMEICIHCQSKVNTNASKLSIMCKSCNMLKKCALCICEKFHCFNCLYFCEKCNKIHCKNCFKRNIKHNYNMFIKLGACNDILQTQKDKCNIENFKKKVFTLRDLLLNSGSKKIIKKSEDEDSLREYLKTDKEDLLLEKKIIKINN